MAEINPPIEQWFLTCNIKASDRNPLIINDIPNQIRFTSLGQRIDVLDPVKYPNNTATNISSSNIINGYVTRKQIILEEYLHAHDEGDDSTSGTSGTSGNIGISGTSGTSGSHGTSGSSGSSGTAGSSGSSGSSGSPGTSGSSGTSGEDRFPTAEADITLVTEVGDPGLDTNVVTEQGIREALLDTITEGEEITNETTGAIIYGKDPDDEAAPIGISGEEDNEVLTMDLDVTTVLEDIYIELIKANIQMAIMTGNEIKNREIHLPTE